MKVYFLFLESSVFLHCLLNILKQYHSSAKTTVTQMKKYGYIIFHTGMIVSPEII